MSASSMIYPSPTRKLSPEEVQAGGSRVWYIPHFPVLKPNKPGKIRVVFDAAAKVHGVSLNDALLKGPDLLNPLPAVLWKFRKARIGFTGDVREFFPQVVIK